MIWPRTVYIGGFYCSYKNLPQFYIRGIYFSYFSIKTYVVGTHLKHLSEMLQISTLRCFKWVPTTYVFCGEIRKISICFAKNQNQKQKKTKQNVLWWLRLLHYQNMLCTFDPLKPHFNTETRGPRATTRSPKWNRHCRYADGMQHFSNTLMTRQWLKQFLKYLAYKVKMLKFSKRHE